jgi:type I pantothenate kinase
MLAIEDLARLLPDSDAPLLVGVTGSVASGKSTLCTTLAEALKPRQTDVISTDGFLLPTAVLETKGIALRKGFPESYDADTLLATLAAARTQAVSVPVYSHVTYDPDPALSRAIDRPDVLIVEGLALGPLPDGRSARPLLDLLIYIDAAEQDLEDWFAARFMQFWHAAENDPNSFYRRFRHMSQNEAEAFARGTVWGGINLPNLREHIVRARDDADIVLRKGADHSLSLVRAPV